MNIRAFFLIISSHGVHSLQQSLKRSHSRLPPLQQSSISIDECYPFQDQGLCENTFSERETIADATKERSADVIDTIRSKSLKELKLECSRRNIRYAGFQDEEEFVQAILKNISDLTHYSLTGSIVPGRVQDISNDHLEEELKSNVPLLLDIYATWCGPCKLVIPEFEAAARKLGKTCRVAKLDSGIYDKLASKYEVQGLPTTLLIHKGKVVERIEGTVSREQLVEFVEPYV